MVLEGQQLRRLGHREPCLPYCERQPAAFSSDCGPGPGQPTSSSSATRTPASCTAQLPRQLRQKVSVYAVPGTDALSCADVWLLRLKRQDFLDLKWQASPAIDAKEGLPVLPPYQYQEDESMHLPSSRGRTSAWLAVLAATSYSDYSLHDRAQILVAPIGGSAPLHASQLPMRCTHPKPVCIRL